MPLTESIIRLDSNRSAFIQLRSVRKMSDNTQVFVHWRGIKCLCQKKKSTNQHHRAWYSDVKGYPNLEIKKGETIQVRDRNSTKDKAAERQGTAYPYFEAVFMGIVEERLVLHI